MLVLAYFISPPRLSVRQSRRRAALPSSASQLCSGCSPWSRAAEGGDGPDGRVRVCACVCVCERVRVCVRESACVCEGGAPTFESHHIPNQM